MVEIRVVPHKLRQVFTFTKYGGKEGALLAALLWRNDQLAALGIPNDSSTPVFTYRSKAIYKSDHSTGIVGVCYHRPRAGGKAHFSAGWRENGKPRFKTFSVVKYGYDGALQLAVEHRSARVAELYGCAFVSLVPQAKGESRQMTVCVQGDDLVGFGIHHDDVAVVNCCRIADDGEFILIKEQGRLFIRFYRADSARRVRLLTAPKNGFEEQHYLPRNLNILGVMVGLFRGDQPAEMPLLSRLRKAIKSVRILG
ncbi:MAG: S24 family peptidase [Pyrinomonadaceae bacterium]